MRTGTFKAGEDSRRNKAGRPKGSKNIKTEELRGLVKEFLSANLPDMQELFNKLPEKDKINVLIQLSKIAIPAPVTSIFDFSEHELEILVRNYEEKKTQLKN